MSDGETTVERRKVPRRRVYKAGKISFSNDNIVLPVIIRNMTKVGAKLVLQDDTIPPRNFILHVEMDGVAYECEVIWRSRELLGVEFKSQPTKSRFYRPQMVETSDISPAPSIRKK